MANNRSEMGNDDNNKNNNDNHHHHRRRAIIADDDFAPLSEEYAKRLRFVGEHCGQHGDYTFYKAIAFVHPADQIERILMTGEFFYLHMSNRREKFIAIGEIQLLWQASDCQTPICSLRVFLEPERVNRLDCGEHEVFQVDDRIIMKLTELVPLMDFSVGKKLRALNYQWSPTKEGPPIGPRGWPLGDDYLDKNEAMFPKEIPVKYLQLVFARDRDDFVKEHFNFDYFDFCHFNETKLDFSDVLCERQKLSKASWTYPKISTVVVLSLSRYSRLRSTLKYIEGREKFCHGKVILQDHMASYGVPLEREKPVQIVFCRDVCSPIGHLSPELNRNYHLLPVLKTPRKRKAPTLDEEALEALWKTGRVTRSAKLAMSLAAKESSSDGSSSSTSSSSAPTPPPPPPPPPPMVTPPAVTRSPKRAEQGLVSKRFLDKLQDVDRVEIRIDRLFPTELIFMTTLHKFMKDRGTTLRVPLLGAMNIDLHLLFTLTQKLGGYEEVSECKLWKDLFFYMGGLKTCTSAATSLRRHYEKLLLPLETHLKARARDTGHQTRSKANGLLNEAAKSMEDNNVKVEPKQDEMAVATTSSVPNTRSMISRKSRKLSLLRAANKANNDTGADAAGQVLDLSMSNAQHGETREAPALLNNLAMNSGWPAETNQPNQNVMNFAAQFLNQAAAASAPPNIAVANGNNLYAPPPPPLANNPFAFLTQAVPPPPSAVSVAPPTFINSPNFGVFSALLMSQQQPQLVQPETHHLINQILQQLGLEEMASQPKPIPPPTPQQVFLSQLLKNNVATNPFYRFP